MGSVAESISRFTNTVGDTISVTFKNISDFIDSVITVSTSLGFWLSVLGFFLTFALIILIPLIVVRYWDNIINGYKRVFNKIVNKAGER